MPEGEFTDDDVRARSEYAAAIARQVRMGDPVARDPENDEEWQDAATNAHAMLLIAAAAGYGLVKPGINVNIGRCEEVLERARARGFEPDEDAAVAKLWQLNAEALVERRVRVLDRMRGRRMR